MLGLNYVVLILKLDKSFFMNVHELVGQSAIIVVFLISVILGCPTTCSRFVLSFKVGQHYHHHPSSLEN